jgi:hypothetical protein
MNGFTGAQGRRSRIITEGAAGRMPGSRLDKPGHDEAAAVTRLFLSVA